jgi:hypothetical protein
MTAADFQCPAALDMLSLASRTVFIWIYGHFLSGPVGPCFVFCYVFIYQGSHSRLSRRFVEDASNMLLQVRAQHYGPDPPFSPAFPSFSPVFCVKTGENVTPMEKHGKVRENFANKFSP